MLYAFADFELDLRTRELRLPGGVVSVGPKPFDFLALLVSKRGAVVTKEDLYAALWPDAHISEAAITSTVKLARRALREGGVRESEGIGIKTVHGRGFRFVGDVVAKSTETMAGPEAVPDAEVLPARIETGFVGRAPELGAMLGSLEKAWAGESQTALVVGEAGIGKTALVDMFVEQARTRGARIARGQAIEHYGQDEPYLPVLEAVSRLASGFDADQLVAHMRRVAPCWLAHLPGLDGEETARLRSITKDRTSGRMLREMADLLEMVSRERPLVLVLEDVHWSDHATLELLTYLIQRRSRSRVLLVATYRPSEMGEADPGLVEVAQDLGGRGRGVEVRVGTLEPAEVRSYLRHRLSGGDLDPELVDRLHQRTDGHPLFLSNVVDVALQEARIARNGTLWKLASDLQSFVPSDLKKVIDRQVGALSEEERALLEAASAAGPEFSVGALTTAVGQSVADLDARCESLAGREQFLEDAGIDEWPDGTIAGRYRFVHTMYVDALYARIASARRARLHRAIAERLEQAFLERSDNTAGELAIHFELGRDARRAIAYRLEAAKVATARHAGREALAHVKAARVLLPEVPADERRRLELDILLELVRRTRSVRAAEGGVLRELISRALELAREFGTGEECAQLLVASSATLLVDGDTREASAAAVEALELSRTTGSTTAAVQAHFAMGNAVQHAGDLEAADAHYREALALYDSSAHLEHMAEYGEVDPGVRGCMWLAQISHGRGLLDDSIAHHEDGIRRAEALQHPLSTCWAHLMAALAFLARSDPEKGREALARAHEISEREGFESEMAIEGLAAGGLHLISGRADLAVEALESVLPQYARLGGAAFAPLCQSLLGTSYGFLGRFEEAERAFGDALALASRTEQPLVHAGVVRTYTLTMTVVGQMAPDDAEARLCASQETLRGSGDCDGQISGAVQIAKLRIARGDAEGARAILDEYLAQMPPQPTEERVNVLEALTILGGLDARTDPG